MTDAGTPYGGNSEHRARALVDERSQGGRCELCGRLGRNVHHRMKQGRPWHGANLLRLCGSGTTGCHGAFIEANPEHAKALGLWVPRTHDPRLVPMFCKPVLFWLGWWYADDDGMWIPAHVDPTPEQVAAEAALHRFLVGYAKM